MRKVRTGLMPPSGVKRPDRTTLDAFAADVEKRLDAEAALHPNPGSPGLHRLNRTEYANAIHDLLGLDVDVSTLFLRTTPATGLTTSRTRSDFLLLSSRVMYRRH